MTFRAAFAALSVAAIVAPATAEAQTSIVALSEHDEAAYRDAFAAIESGNWRGVGSALTRTEDDVLEGAVRGRLLLSRSYRASWSDYTSWLNRYGEYGMAEAVHDRAMDSRSRRARRNGTRAPDAVAGPGRVLPGTPPPIPGDSASARAGIERIVQSIAAGDFEGARNQAYAQVGGARSGQAQWQLGLIAYHQHDYEEAARQFEASAQWAHHGGWARAATHYWAARARLAAGEPSGIAAHLEAAADRPWTFYGQLAEAQLGRESGLSFEAPVVDSETLQRFIERYPGARRAAALAQLGRLSEVESELRRLHADLSREDDVTFLGLAIALRAPAAQLRAAEFGGPEVAAGFCPATSFEPDDGFSLDRAVLYAIVRQESYFNPKAVSVSNARGLMQLLPSTARDMDRSTNYRRNPSALFEPGLNMRLGQSYIRWLMTEFHNDGDLGRVFAAYNGGPGWLSRWLATQPADIDPLLLLEMLPRAESRDYAERALSHMALCRKSYGQPTPELDRLVSGEPALYTPLDVARIAQR
ncbi:lytic transglycosylase domain-containing protein [Terricaulis silvestris]|uniref:Soluble lytic murein transglycosylase n=1 Tax=Terricaulis silvestris TaxID=2686094 RepID=A0A6I6MQV6_9CAUL|nr:lytic transglycosylase domain-containing protein [Terricaulis silvestris]QGZ95808.1 Soluble lytic murein transglycosylase precursor [Terricaulis silvestris]